MAERPFMAGTDRRLFGGESEGKNMAIFECQVRGAGPVRLVKAATSAQARDHIVSAKAISAERMADVMATGVTLEVATDATDPASHAPGGALHGKAEDDGLIVDGKLDPAGALKKSSAKDGGDK